MSAGGLLKWILLALALGLLVVVIMTRRDAQVPDATVAPPLGKGDGAGLTTIHCTNGALQLELERVGGTWYLREPFNDLASTRMLRELVRTLENTQIRRVIATDDLARFGLENPAQKMTLVMRDGREIYWALGDTAPASGEIYMHWTGLSGVALVAPYMRTRFFEADLLLWRERDMLPPARQEIDSVRVILPNQEVIRVRRHAREEWSFINQPGREADGLECERAVAAFWRFAFTTFIDDPGEWPALGLAEPHATWIVYRGGAVDTLFIGAPVDEEHMAVRLAGRSPGLVRNDLYGRLTGGVDYLEVRHLLGGRPKRQLVVLIADDDGGYCYARWGTGWHGRTLDATELAAAVAGTCPDATRGAWTAANDPALAGDLSNISELKATAWVLPPEPLAQCDYQTLRMHFWDWDGTYRWAYFQADAGLPAGDRPSFAGRALGSRLPERPMFVRSTAIERWRARLARTRN